jgi:Ca-activated chloride channel family protein
MVHDLVRKTSPSRLLLAGVASLAASACGALTREEPAQWRPAGYLTSSEGARAAALAPVEMRDEEANSPEPAGAPAFVTEAYDHIVENRFVSPRTSPFSTFSVDVDTASYSNVRRFLTTGARPPAGAVRIEELINYFDYEYEGPVGDAPVAIHTEVAPAPWAPEHRLLHIGLQARRIPAVELPPRNLVFLVDVSGSMDEPNKLPLLKSSFRALLGTLTARDSVALVVYAGASGLVLPPTPGDQRETILDALERLEAGGSTNGAGGIQLAYQVAQQSARPGGVSRVLLATDGDFNVGTTSQSELVRLIEQKRDSGVFLTVLGFGMGNYKDSTLEKLADHGNGNYAYIDDLREARKVLVEEGGANLVTVAKDVKVQVEFHPAAVGAYRLIGYENRALRTEDFRDDRKDAGDMGAGHSVTALYELLTPAQAADLVSVDAPRYGGANGPQGSAVTELAHVKLRYKTPQGSASRLLEVAVPLPERTLGRPPSQSFRFSAAVASFGMLLRNSEYKANSSYGLVAELARGALGNDAAGHRREFLNLVSQAESL